MGERRGVNLGHEILGGSCLIHQKSWYHLFKFNISRAPDFTIPETCSCEFFVIISSLLSML